MKPEGPDPGYRFSIIIPVYHEAETVNALINHIHEVAAGQQYEIIVVDGSEDQDTLKAIRDETVVKLASQKGRAQQMNAGAAAARGEILLFLHADTKLPPKGLHIIGKALENHRYVAGAFNLCIDSPHLLLKFISLTGNLRNRITRVPYGDQGIFIRKNYFDRIGGYKELPIMEDAELMKRIKKRGDKICLLKQPSRTSPRRWEQGGIVRTTFTHHKVRILYSLGVSPEKLLKLRRSR